MTPGRCLPLRSVGAIAAGLVAGLMWSGAAHATLFEFQLGDHPDGTEAPPEYGLRLDGIEHFVTGSGGDSDTWTFTFDCVGCDVTATFDTVTEDFVISGIAFGGRDVDAPTGDNSYDPGTGGFVEVMFTYFDISPIGFTPQGAPEFDLAEFSGGAVLPSTASGSITFSEINGAIAAGTEVHLLGYAMQADPHTLFQFIADEHRLDGSGELCEGEPDAAPECDNPVGRGWMAFWDKNDEFGDNHDPDVFHTKSQDWIFTTLSFTKVPEPDGLALIGVGLLGLGVARVRHGRG